MANDVIFTNNASALLAASIDDTDTTIQVASGFGDLFPSPSGSQVAYLTLEDDSGNVEIVQCTARTGDNLTVVRAQDGTTAQAFTLNVTRVELRVVKIVLEEFLQKNGGTMTGDVDFNTNTITDAYIAGSSTRITGGQIVNVPIRGLLDTSTNEIAVPTDGTSRATVGGAAILAAGDDIVAELDTAGVITLDSATVGVVMDQASAYFRMRGALRVADSAGADYCEQSHDGTDYNFLFTNTTEVNWDATLRMTAPLILNDNLLQRAVLQDFSIDQQTVSGESSTTIDYTAGSYVILNLTANIGTLTLSNPPAGTAVGSMRLKVVQDSTARTITWPASVEWPGGTAPTLPTGSGDVCFIDLWTDDGGTTWYGSFNQNAWS